MPTSKILVLSFLSLSLWNLTSCTIPAPQLRNPEDSANATFLITDARGDALTAPLTKDFATPQSKTFTFTVCLKDRAQSRPLIGHSFRIEEINKELKSDAKGCLNWSEDVPFNFLSAPKYVEWKRQITATGLHKGTQTAHFAINPWNDNDNSQAVVNLETVTPPQLVSEPEQIRTVLKGNSEGASPVKNSLWINSLNLQSYEQKFTSEGVILNFELMTVPQLQIYKLNGETMFRSLSQGHFKVTFYLIHLLRENNQEVHRLLAQSVPQTVEMKGGNLFIKYPLKLQSRPPQGQLILGLDISGDGQDKNLGNFQGIYMIGDYDQFKGTKGLRLMNVVTESNDFKISSYINSNLSEDKGAYVQPRIEISPLEFKYLRVGKESTADREIIYNIKACFKNGLDQKSLQGVAFNVHGFRQSSTDPVKTLSLTADNSSCINWDESLTFKYYECHRHLTGFIEIENQDLAVQQKLEVALNPWEPTGSFARNLLKKEDHDNLITDCKKENILPSMMSLKTMTYSTFSYNYEIDPLLNLTFKKKLRFKLDAVVNIASDMNKGRTDNAQKLRPGVYLLKLALIKNRDYYNEKTYVSSVEKLVATIDGDIRTDVEFKTADLKAIKGRNTLLLELDPVREDKVTVDKDGNVSVKEKVNSLDEVIDYNTGLYNRTFNAAMSLNADADYEELTPLDPKDINQYLTNANLPAINGARSSMVREYIKYGAKLAADNFEAQKVQADMDLFAKNNSLKKISIQGMNGAEDLHAALAEAPTRMNDAHIKEELGSFATTGKMSLKLSRGFCSFWFKNFIAKDLEKLFGYHSYVECDLHANRPEQLFTIEKRLFVKDFESYGLIKGYNSNLSVSNNITLSKSQSQSTSFSKSLNINVDFSFLNSLLSKVARLFSVGISGSYSISQSDSRAEANSNSVSVGTGVSLLLQQNIYQLKLKRYQECSTVKINPTQFLKKGLFASALKSRLKEEEKAEIASRGLMICTGTDNTTPLVHNENYYLLTQDLGGTQIQDSGDSRNYNFFIALRGEKEFQRLMYFLKGNLQMPQSADRSTDNLKYTLTNLDILFNTGFANAPGSINDTP